jgi:MFS family permease
LSDEVFQPRLQLVLAQVTTASILASLAIGSPSYIGASLLRRRSLIGRSSFLSSCAGGLSGGVLGGILLGPLLLTYFGEINRPISGPLVVIPGGLAGVSVVAFVLLSYDVANVSYRRLYSAIRAVATGAVLVSLCCVIIFLPFGQSIIGALREIYSNQDWFPLQFVGIIVGGIGGGILGSVIGISVARSEREVPSI